MYVVNDLRVPNIVNLVYGELRLDLGKSIPVAVVIVAHVLVVKLRRVGAFLSSAKRFVVPVLNDVNTVRIEGRTQKNDRVLQDLLNVGFV